MLQYSKDVQEPKERKSLSGKAPCQVGQRTLAAAACFKQESNNSLDTGAEGMGRQLYYIMWWTQGGLLMCTCSHLSTLQTSTVHLQRGAGDWSQSQEATVGL